MSGFITIALLHFLAVILPGPDYAIVLKNSLFYDKQHGAWTSVGIAFGVCIHIFYCIMGVAVVISQSSFIFKTMQCIGGLYLAYIGVQSLLCNNSKDPLNKTNSPNYFRSKWVSFREGFFCNILNPKATLFFLSLFTLVISPATPLSILFLYSIEMFLVTLLWFMFLSIIITKANIRKHIEQLQPKINIFMGSIFIFFGIKLFFM